MPRKKKTDTAQPPPKSNETPDAQNPDQGPTSLPEEGRPPKNFPVFKAGPILTDRNNSVECAVWANEVTLGDGSTFTVHSVTVQASYRDAEGNWKPAKSYRGSHLYALMYCLQRARVFILSQRDPANDCSF